ncbi:hypothetical protein C2I36_06570 [Rhodobacteraceae bacterium WD3A24]|nr:hypothetical protein C2I36_06570 [Rhodobacteraceae bacterium WD3A24]
MSGAADIENRRSLERWLEDRPREDAVIIAHRAAMRVLPVLTDWLIEFGKGDLTELPVLRCLLASMVAGKRPSYETKSATADAITGSVVVATEVENAIADAAASAAAAAARASIRSKARIATRPAVRHAFFATDHAVALKCSRADAQGIEFGETPHSQPLWHDEPNPLDEQWQTTRRTWASRGPGWQFWIDWYEDALGGREPNWEMLRDIALIAPETWDAGPDALNAEIMRITEKHSLLEEIRALKAERARLVENAAAPAHRGHNEPPELIEAPVEVARELTVVWTSLDEAERELEKAQPDLSRLQRIANALKAAVGQVAAYCGKVGDRAVMAGAGAFGTGAGTLLLDHFFTSGRLMDFATRLLQFAVGG